MKLDLSDLNKGSVTVGEKLIVRSMYSFDEETTILWSGIKLITNPPCQKKELQIAASEIFSMGTFEAGEYIRDKPILIKNNVVPTIKKRNLEYNIELIMRQTNPINKNDDLLIKRTHNIEIIINNPKIEAKKPNPVAFSISGLSVNITKDIFKPGETIKVNFKSENLKELELRLLQKANLICTCAQFGKNCTNTDELPPAIAGDVKTSRTEEGFMLLKVPEIAEPTHNYLWEPSEKEHWGVKYGDYTEWSLLVIGRKRPEFGRDQIQFEVPLTILAKSTYQEGTSEVDLFAKGVTGGMNVFDGAGAKFQKRFQLISIDSESDGSTGMKIYKVKMKNISKEDLEGVTVKLSGLQEGLFETSPELKGYKFWGKDQEKELVYSVKQNISAIVSNIEDNSQKAIRIQTPISF